MPIRIPSPAELEPIETASRDEIDGVAARAPQGNARACVRARAALSPRVRRRGRASPIENARRPRALPVHRARPIFATTIRSACSRCRGATSCACTRRRARRASPRSSATREGRHRHVGHGDGAVDPCGGRATGRHRARRLRLRPLHRGPRRALRRREARLHRRAHVRRADGEAGAADHRLPARRDHGDAVVHARDRRGDGAPGHRSAHDVARASASSAPSRGRRRCARRSRRSSTSTPSTSTVCRRSWGPASRRSASRRRTASRSGRTISIRRSIDPATGAVLPDGEQGELVFTSLTKQALPIIRYRTRDLTRLLPPTARSMRRMEKITGRSDDMLIIRGVNVFPTQIEELILKQPMLAPHYQLEITRPRASRRADRAGRARAGRGRRRR